MGKPKKKLSAYNRYMSKALKGKMTGKTEAQRKTIFKAAAKGWKKGKSTPRSSKPKTRASTSRRSNPTGGTRRMTKNSFNMSKIYALARKGALIAPLAFRLMEGRTPQQTGVHIVRDYTGWDMNTGRWSLEHAKVGWTPFIFTSIITKVVPAINKLIRSIF